MSSSRVVPGTTSWSRPDGRGCGGGSRLPEPRDVLLIGLAGGTVARQLTAYGPIPITGVEIDPEINEVAREYFALDELENVDVIVADGRYALRTSDAIFDLIGVDAYRQPYIPFQLTSREFFQDVSAHLRPGGVAVVNAGRTRTDFRLVEALAATMRDVFPHVVAIDVDRYTNTILVGSQSPLSADAPDPERRAPTRAHRCARSRVGVWPRETSAPLNLAVRSSPTTAPCRARYRPDDLRRGAGDRGGDGGDGVITRSLVVMVEATLSRSPHHPLLCLGKASCSHPFRVWRTD